MKALSNVQRFVKEQVEHLRQLRDTPPAVAGGVAFGIFWGFTPLTGFKTLLAILFAWIFRCSKVAAVIAVSLHDILSPIWPIVLRWEYDFGFWVLSHPHHFPKRLRVEDAFAGGWFHLKTLEVLWPMSVGYLIFAVPFSLISYWIVERSLEGYERTHRRGQGSRDQGTQ